MTPPVVPTSWTIRIRILLCCLILNLVIRLSEPSLFPRAFLSVRNKQQLSSSSSSPQQPPFSLLWTTTRGGAATNEEATATNEADNDDNDDERYSRQVYTLGARAHGLVRSSTVYLDGPPGSGLMYETAKNLALSGVRHIVFLVQSSSSSSHETDYHDAALDDLGNSYQRAARAEIGVASTDKNGLTDIELLKEYVQRLNPSVTVSLTSREDIRGRFINSSDSSAGTAPSLQNGRHVLLAIDRPYSSQVLLNQFCRELDMAFVSVETAGTFGRTFCDFGSSFEVYDADGEMPLVTPFDRVELGGDEGGDDGGSTTIITVCSVEGEKHDVSKGETIQFQWRDGSLSEMTFVVTEVKTPFCFRVEMPRQREQGSNDVDEILNRINQQAASFRRIKIPQLLSFEPLNVATDRARKYPSLFTPSDLDKSFDSVRRTASFSCFQALSTFVEQQQRLPTHDDMIDFWKLVQESWVQLETDNDDDASLEDYQRHCRNFIHGCAAKLSPLQCVFGAIAAQEALKAATGLYYPTHQFLLYDCDEILGSAPETIQDTTSTVLENTDPLTAPGLRRILGNSVVDKLQSQRIFLVGCGAIGCEILKNLASMGIGTRKKGRICLTDMDTIEKSNLSRQLLFRDSDVGIFKSTAAHAAALRFNPSLKVESHSSRVGDSSGNSPFDEKFWSENVNVVMNALDNVEARLYMDAQCVANQKALVDAGTMGPKGNVQVVVPHQSESYASSTDPPEPAIPVCTLKNFPYAISHTIQWGRDLFDGLFERRPNQANDFLDSLGSADIDSLASRLVREKGEDAALQAAEELSEDLSALAGKESVDWQASREESLVWAARLARSLFFDAAEALQLQHPLDSVDEDGEPFWSGTRRPPRKLSFLESPDDSDQAKINENIVEFVKTAARLRLETFAKANEIDKSTFFSSDEVVAFLRSSNVADTCPQDGNNLSDDSNQPQSERVHAFLGKVSSESRTLRATEFEKDDDSNGHVTFVNAASNLRAIAYWIPPVDAMETRRVAGNIVPAMITTTAFVSALSCIELVKLTQKAPLKLHRNAFVNLALPFFAFTVPLPAEQMSGLNGKTYTLWDRLTIKEGQKAAASGGLTMRSLLRRIKKQIAGSKLESINVASVSCGPYMLFANFLHDEDEGVLGSSVWKLVEEAVSSESLDDSTSREGDDSPVVEVDCSNFVDLAVIVEDLENGEEIELPVIRVQRYAE